MIRSTVAVLSLAAALAGCAAPSPAVKEPFDLQALAPYRRDDGATLVGQATMPIVNGQTATCAGADVTLFPDTPYYREIFGRMAKGQASDLGANKEAARSYLRGATCDAQGRFSFTGLPAASWIVIVDVHWIHVGQPQKTGLAKGAITKAKATARVELGAPDRVNQ